MSLGAGSGEIGFLFCFDFFGGREGGHGFCNGFCKCFEGCFDGF